LIVGLWSAPGTVPVEPRLLNNANVKIIGTAIYEARHLYEAIRVATQYHDRFPLTEVVSHQFSLTETENALRAVKDLTTIKAVVRPHQASV
jgi:5-exo-hydroxycamphor dehydrogenase